MGKAEPVDLKLLGLFGAKDSEAGKSPTWSPTSALDFGVFANFGGLFSPRCPAPSSSPRFNKWVCDKVGLSLLTSTIGDGEENIVLAPQIKVNVIVSSTRVELSTKSFDPCVLSDPLPNNIDSQPNSPSRSSSSPMDIISQVYSREMMALSEDYTCIISHGPNPKTTHIFGDCILDCDPSELRGLGTQGDGDSFSRLCLCPGKPQDCQSTPPHIHRSALKPVTNLWSLT